MVDKIGSISIPYAEAGFFSKLVTDYLNEKEELKEFYKHPVSIEGIKASIEERKSFNTNRKLLVDQLTNQYKGIQLTAIQTVNLQALLAKETFTVTTAHQPNIFTGPLYFVYKIIHAIKLADELKEQLPEYDFIPVYYMGSEDADLDELGNITLNGEKLIWNTNQTGAVGRMKVDKGLLQIIKSIAGQIGIHPYGNDLINLYEQCFTIGKTIQQATLELVNSLFADYGLLILIPDNAPLKASFNKIIKKELVQQFSHVEVLKTVKELSKLYKVQASGRELNLFYLFEDKRERIELKELASNGKSFTVSVLKKEWTLNDILIELNEFPERFSGNVILRGLFQETILPNIAFIGGGGELAYWLELKGVFDAANIPYPVLLLRNSLLLVNDKQANKIEKLGLTEVDSFLSSEALLKNVVLKHSENKLDLTEEVKQLNEIYSQLKNKVSTVDATLIEHIDSLEKLALKKVIALERKMLRAEKRKFKEHQHQIIVLKQSLFPHNNLQERVENFSTFYALYGEKWLQLIYKASLTLEQEFCILKM